jgi:hypothetical protein
MQRSGVLGELVTFNNSRGLHLDGILYQGDRNKTTIIHIHGSLGNFYQNQFLRFMAKKYLEIGINFLSFNLSCHDGIGEGFRYEDGFEYVGGSVAPFSSCLYDIEGAISFISPFSDRVILQGHSLGCDRVLHFLTTNRASYDFILLSPCDSYNLQSIWLANESVADQINRLRNQKPFAGAFDWLPSQEYGVRQKGEDYVIPITRPALLSIIDGPPFRLINIAKPSPFYLSQNCYIYIGGNDALQTSHPDVMFSYFEKRVSGVTRSFVPHGDHDLSGCEQEVIQGIVSWCAYS